MPTPIFALRLPQKVQDDIAQLSRVYGAPNPRAFAREILEVMVSGDEVRVKEFLSRFFQRVTAQLALELEAVRLPPVVALQSGIVNVNTTKRRPARRKRRRRARAT